MANLDVRIVLRGGGLAEADELSLRHKFQEEVERRGIGKDLGGGSGFGEMDISVEVSDAETGKSKLRALAEELGIKDGLIIEEAAESGDDLFGEVISCYSREQAIEDGYLVDVSEVGREAGILFPVALTRAVFEKCVAVPEGLEGLQDETGRLWDVVWMLQYGIRSGREGGDELRFNLRVQNDKEGPKEVTL